jgi:NAD-dependent deacetylase
MTGTTSSPLDAAVQALEGARAVVVVTGAGMSQESGVPTFRDAQTGLWARFDPTELATEAAFRQHPARVFGWYLWRRHLIKKATPHPGYRALVRLEDLFDELLVVTQNVDGLHRSSGSGDVVELHGSLDAFRCLDRGHPFAPRRRSSAHGRLRRAVTRCSSSERQRSSIRQPGSRGRPWKEVAS